MFNQGNQHHQLVATSARASPIYQSSPISPRLSVLVPSVLGYQSHQSSVTSPISPRLPVPSVLVPVPHQSLSISPRASPIHQSSYQSSRQSHPSVLAPVSAISPQLSVLTYQSHFAYKSLSISPRASPSPVLVYQSLHQSHPSVLVYQSSRQSSTSPLSPHLSVLG
jgi:hypothetical protein